MAYDVNPKVRPHTILNRFALKKKKKKITANPEAFKTLKFCAFIAKMKTSVFYRRDVKNAPLTFVA